MQRRNFIKQTGLLGAGMWTSRLPLMAGPFTAYELQNGKIPAEKKIDPAWIRSLYERGSATTYLKTKNELHYIGMPVGGINTGTLYLGGDGRLWLWDIFNLNQEGINPLELAWSSGKDSKRQRVRSRDGSAYIAPAKADEIRPLEQGIAVKLEYEGKTIIRRLAEEDWEEIAFEATYPVAKITYTDKQLPVTIEMYAYSPFIPLDEERSGLPATIFKVEIKNTGNQPVKAAIVMWLENKTAIHSAKATGQLRTNTGYKTNDAAGVYASVENLSYPRSKIEDKFDYGTLCLTALHNDATTDTDIETATTEMLFQQNTTGATTKSVQQKLTGSVSRSFTVAPGLVQETNFIISWHTPNLVIGNGKVLPETDRGRYYDNRFKNARDVADYVVANFKQLSSQTFLWQETWYDSSLPHWFLERSFLNISSLATTTSHRFKSGRYWAWEGVGACEGNCTHVWQYAQAVGRIFPAMERDNRERVDLGIALQENGGIWFRAEYDKRPAIDGQAGRILGIYREHQMSANNNFLQRNWEKTKKAIQFVINQDRNGDGMEDTPLENTLDAVWDGEIAWIVGLCITAVKAGEMMALEMKDTDFAMICKTYVEKGRKNMETLLFNGEYFIHRPDAVKGKKKLGSYNTCHIDQVFGQSWAFQLGLGRVLDKEKTVSALRALWNYNFMPDVGPYIHEHQGGRPYALAGEGGMIMNTNPGNETKPYGEDVTWQLGYFHECMSGFEHQVASHLMAEDMQDEALILTRTIHDRYHAAKRNPFNEIECSDHYARAMASYGTFVTACGFEYHGPKGFIRFAPKWDRDNFKAPFVSAEGWGTYTQQKQGNKQVHSLQLKYGSLRLMQLSFDKLNEGKIKQVTAMIDGQKLPLSFMQKGSAVLIGLTDAVQVKEGQSLDITIQS